MQLRAKSHMTGDSYDGWVFRRPKWRDFSSTPTVIAISEKMEIPSTDTTKLAVLATISVILLSVLVSRVVKLFGGEAPNGPLPPHVPHTIPFLGNAVRFGLDPVGFLKECQKLYGDTFTFTMIGKFLYLILQGGK